MVRAVELEEAGRDPDLQLVGELLHRQHRGMLGGRPGGREQALVLDPAEIGAFEQFGRKHDLGALARGFADEVGHVADVGAGVVGEGELQRGDGELGHCGYLLRDAVEAAAAGQDVVGAQADCNAVGEQRLDDVDRGLVVGRAILRDDDRGIADVEVHVARRDDVAVVAQIGPGEGRVTMSSPAARSRLRGVAIDGLVGVVLGRRRDRDAARRDEPREIVDMAVGMVVGEALAEPHDALEAEVARQPLLRPPRATAWLRLGLSRHCSVVMTRAAAVMVDRAALEDPVGLANRAGAAEAASRSPMLSSPGRSYLPPQPLKPKPAARRCVPDPQMIGPVSRSQMSPNGSTITLAKGASLRAAAAASSCAATSRTSSPLPSAWTAAAKAATSRSACLRSASHSSGSLGKPIHTASCGAHSGSGGWVIGAPRSNKKGDPRGPPCCLSAMRAISASRIRPPGSAPSAPDRALRRAWARG